MYEKYTPVRGRFVSLSDTKYRGLLVPIEGKGSAPRAPLFEAFLDTLGALSERPDIRTLQSFEDGITRLNTHQTFSKRS